MRKGARLRVVPPEPDAGVVPRPPSWMDSDQREVWDELAPQVVDVYQAKFFTAFTALVLSVSAMRACDPAASEFPRLVQSANMALGRWGLTPKDVRNVAKKGPEGGGRHGQWRRR